MPLPSLPRRLVARICSGVEPPQAGFQGAAGVRRGPRPVSLASVLLGSALFVGAGTPDTTPARITSVSIMPTMVDVTEQPQTVTVDVGVTDDLSGATLIELRLSGPERHQNFPAGFALVNGTPLDGTWRGTFTIPRFVEPGTWNLSSAFLQDGALNRSFLTDTQLQSLGLQIAFTVDSEEDIEPPEPVQASLSPTAIDVRAGPRNFTVSLTLHDGPAGATRPSSIAFSSPSGSQRLIAALFASDGGVRLVNGNINDGTWEIDLTFPPLIEGGLWTMDWLQLRDNAGNEKVYVAGELADRGLDIKLNVTSGPEDTSPPVLADISLSPAVADPSTGQETVTFDLHVRDDLSGVDFSRFSRLKTSNPRILLRSPSGGQFVNIFPEEAAVAGDAWDGHWQGTFSFSEFAEQGTWRIEEMFLVDEALNTRYLSTADLEAMGFQTRLTVVRPSLDRDGSTGSAGGTVRDEVFGDRAQITFPPGVLAQTTEVMIDVLEGQFDLSMPRGFQTVGTRFVNLSLEPQPQFPLPAPGVSLTLPLVDPMPPGATLSLFTLDTMTGQMVEALGVDGEPIVGSVTADGLSAVFDGVAHFSIFAGLAAASQSLYFPQAAEGGGILMELLLTNPTSESAAGTIRFFSNDGSPQSFDFEGGPKTSLDYQLNPGGAVRLTSDGTGQARSGYAVLEGMQPSSQVTAVLLYRLNGTTVSVSPSPASRRQHLFVESNQEEDTGVALANLATHANSVRLILLSEDGAKRDETEITLEPGEHRAQFLAQLFPGLEPPFRGSLQLIGERPFALLGLLQDRTTLGLAALSGGLLAYDPAESP